MAHPITVYVAADGSRWDAEEDAIRRDELCRAGEAAGPIGGHLEELSPAKALGVARRSLERGDQENGLSLLVSALVTAGQYRLDLIQVCEAIDALDCCEGYSFPDDDWPKLWRALGLARWILARMRGEPETKAVPQADREAPR